MREDEFWMEVSKEIEEMEKLCEECQEKKERNDVDLCYGCAKNKAKKAGVELSFDDYMDKEM